MDPDPTLDPTPFFRDFTEAKIFLSYNLAAGTFSSVSKIKFFAKTPL
jgi:hypothetical protein